MFSWTPLHLSAYNGHIDVVKYLINHGAEIIAKTDAADITIILALLFITHLITEIFVSLNI